jgi:hypothetical protein
VRTTHLVGECIRDLLWGHPDPEKLLDVVFREDARRFYDRTAAENVAFLNRVALSLLRADPSRSSLKVKRKQAGWDIHYLA